MKKRNILRRILAEVLVLTMATGLTAQAKGDASSTSLKEAQKEKAALEKQLKAAKELINDLKRENKLPNLCTLINGIDMDQRKNGYYYGYGKYGKYGKYGYGKKYGYGYGYGYGK